jgi:sugar phosphate isomerase/epimerase
MIATAIAFNSCSADKEQTSAEKQMPVDVGIGDCFKGPLGLQLYSLREGFKKDVPGTLDAVKAFGFQYVELAGIYGMSPEDFRKELDARGLIAISGLYPIKNIIEKPDEVASEAKTLGLQYVGVAWYSHDGALDEALCRQMAADFNAAGKNMAERGLKFFYHNHGYEFLPHGDGTLFDLLMAETDPNLVSLEMDVLWTIFPGQDPVKLIEKYGNRWELLHLKDLRKGVEGNHSGGTAQTNDVVLGTGQADYPALLKAAQNAGVKWYFIEDESPAVHDQIPQSLKFLERVSW